MTWQQLMNTTILGQTVHQLLVVSILLLVVFTLKVWGAKLANRLLYRLFSKKGRIDRSERFNELVGKPMQFFGLMVALYISFTLLNVPQHLELFEEKIRVHFYLNILLKLLLTIGITRILIKVTEYVGERWLEKAAESESKLDDQLVPFAIDGIKVLLIIFAFMFVLGAIFKANVTALVGGLGIGGLAVALAAQESLANLLGSFTIFLDKPFTVGDIVDFNGIVGTIEKVGFRSTRIRTLDKSYVTVPNKALVGAPLNNITESTHRRARFFIGLTYDTQPDVMKNIIAEIHDVLLRHENTNDNPVVRFFEYTDSSLSILITYLVNSNDYDLYVQVREEINFKIYEIVQRNGTSFAFPTRVVRIEKGE
ncbi:MAG: mechanosensitive ion channel protein MscS [Sphingobacteriaceae bacterium]|nr:mechanosensitive ion channel protein MscS [Sphingobacteriaceae bacterium]